MMYVEDDESRIYKVNCDTLEGRITCYRLERNCPSITKGGKQK